LHVSDSLSLYCCSVRSLHVRLLRALTKIKQSINNSLCLNICSFILWQGPCTQQARRSRHVEGQQCLRIDTFQTGHTRPHWRIQSTIFGASFCRVFSLLTSICSFSPLSLSLSLSLLKSPYSSFSPHREGAKCPKFSYEIYGPL